MSGLGRGAFQCHPALTVVIFYCVPFLSWRKRSLREDLKTPLRSTFLKRHCRHCSLLNLDLCLLPGPIQKSYQAKKVFVGSQFENFIVWRFWPNKNRPAPFWAKDNSTTWLSKATLKVWFQSIVANIIWIFCGSDPEVKSWIWKFYVFRSFHSNLSWSDVFFGLKALGLLLQTTSPRPNWKI